MKGPGEKSTWMFGTEVSDELVLDLYGRVDLPYHAFPMSSGNYLQVTISKVLEELALILYS